MKKITLLQLLLLLCFVVNSFAQQITIHTPTNGSIHTTSVTAVAESTDLGFIVSAPEDGFDGHMEFSVDGQPFTEFSEYSYLTGVNISQLIPGQHTFTVRMVDNTHTPLSPNVEETVTYTVIPSIPVTSISDLRNQTISNDIFYTLNADITITKAISDDVPPFDLNVFAQDATSGIKIKDPTSYFVFSDTDGEPVFGDKTTTMTGKLNDNNGILEFIPTQVISRSSSGNSFTPETVTVDEFNANPEDYESEFIKLECLEFNQTGAFAPDTTYSLNDVDDNTINLEVFFPGVFEFIMGLIDIPSGVNDILVIGGSNSIILYESDTIIEDVTPGQDCALSINENQFKNQLHIYPTVIDTELNIKLPGAFNTSIYNINGQLINTYKSNNELKITNFNWNSGVYFVKINTEKQAYTAKIIKK